MSRISIVFLQSLIILIGISTLVFLLWEPHLEGRNAHATLYEIYFKDPFLACAYVSSILFFVALYQIYKLLGYIGKNELFSHHSVKALRTIRDCSTALVVLIVGAEAYLCIVQRGKDDIAGGAVIGLFMIVIFTLVATSAALFERYLRKKF